MYVYALLHNIQANDIKIDFLQRRRGGRRFIQKARSVEVEASHPSPCRTLESQRRLDPINLCNQRRYHKCVAAGYLQRGKELFVDQLTSQSGFFRLTVNATLRVDHPYSHRGLPKKFPQQREIQFILHNHKYIITKQLLDNIAGPVGYIPINAGQWPPIVAHKITAVLH